MSSRSLSRRACLQGMVLLVAGAMAPMSPSTADAKASKAAVHYRDSPKGMQMCHMCKYYIGSRMGGGMMGRGMMGSGMMRGGMMKAGACQVVEGRISPMGWCDLYAPV